MKAELKTAEGICGVIVDLTNADLRKVKESKEFIQDVYRIKGKIQQLRSERDSTTDTNERIQYAQSIEKLRDELGPKMDKFPRHLANVISFLNQILTDWQIKDLEYVTKESLVEFFDQNPYKW